jgi:Protein of unknown function (DUF3017)
MADKPANAGPSRASATDGVPPPVHHEAPPRGGHRRTAEARRTAGDANARHNARPAFGSWLLYLIVLAGVAIGLFIIWQGSTNAARGAGLVGGSLLVAALARLVLPPRYAGQLSSRRKTSDVLAFAAFGAAVLGVALMLP